MNKCILAGFILLSGIEAFATASLKYDLRSNVDVDWSLETRYEPSWSCYPFGKDAEFDPNKGHETATGAVAGEISGPASVTMTSMTSEFFIVPARTTNLSLSDVQNRDSETLDLSISDAIVVPASFDFGNGDCDEKKYHGHAKGHSISGQIDLRYQMPVNTWLVAITPMKMNLVGAKMAQTIVGGLQPTVISVDQKFYVWAEPGATIQIHFELSGLETGDFGHAQFLFQPVGKVVGGSAAGLEAFKTLSEMKRGSQHNIYSDLTVQDVFLEVAGSLLRSPEAFKDTIDVIGTDRFSEFASQIFEIANAEISDKDGRPDRELPNEQLPPVVPKSRVVKSIAAVLSYQMALQLLTDLQGFCKDVQIDLPFQADHVTKKGFALGYYWLHRSEVRLTAYNYSALTEVLAQTIRYENDKLTYAAVARDSHAFAQLKTGYDRLMNYGNLGSDPYIDFSRDIERTIEQFGSLGSEAQATAQVDADLKMLSQRHLALMSKIIKNLRSFKTDNMTPVLETPFMAELNDILKEKQRIVGVVQSQVKFLSVGNNSDSGNGFMAVITSLLLNEVGIFEKKLPVPYFEPIREDYKKFHNIDNLQSLYQQCIFGVE